MYIIYFLYITFLKIGNSIAAIAGTIYIYLKPTCVEIDKQMINHTPISNQVCNGMYLFLIEYLLASFLLSMLNDKKDNIHC